MKRRNFITFLIIILVAFFNSNAKVRAAIITNSSLSTDKDSYFLYENIQISSSWSLNLNEDENYSIHIEINTTSKKNLWRSSDFFEEGVQEKLFEIKASNLNYTNFNDSAQIKIYLCLVKYGKRDYLSTIKNKSIQILKQNITINLINFDKSLTYGEMFHLKAQFFQKENESNLLSNEMVNLVIMVQNHINYERILETNNLGILNLNLSSAKYFITGKNTIKLSILNCSLSNEFTINFEIEVKKLKPIIIINYELEDFIESKYLKLQVECYYKTLNQKSALSEKYLFLEIFDSSKALIYKADYKTNKNGKIDIKIDKELIDSKFKTDGIRIKIYYKGDSYFEKEEVIIEIDTNQIFWQTQEIRKINSFSFFSISFLILLLLIYIFKKNKIQSNNEDLLNLTFRY